MTPKRVRAAKGWVKHVIARYARRDRDHTAVLIRVDRVQTRSTSSSTR